MLGGMNGLLHRMSKDRVEPNLKTFTELLEVIPSNLKEEGNLLTALKDKAVTPDVDFFSILIKRRCARGSIIAARVNFLFIQSTHV